MAVQIGAKPDSGFDDPIGMLEDCHRRSEAFLGILYVPASCARDEAWPPGSAMRVGRGPGRAHSDCRRNIASTQSTAKREL